MKMGYQGVALLIGVVLGIGLAAYQLYTQYNTAQTHESQSRSHPYTYVPPPTPEKTSEGYSRRRRRSSMVEKCPICQETLMGHLLGLACTHLFHKDCIEEWFKESRTCPVCRSHA